MDFTWCVDVLHAYFHRSSSPKGLCSAFTNISDSASTVFTQAQIER